MRFKQIASIKSLFSPAAKRTEWEEDRNNFFKAIKKGDCDAAKEIAQKYPREFTKWKNDTGTVLVQAHKSNQLEIFKYLLEQGADANEDMKDGWTLLHTTVKKGQHDFATALIENNANLNAAATVKRTYTRQMNGMIMSHIETPLTLSIRRNDKEMLGMLLARGAKLSIRLDTFAQSLPDPIKLAEEKGNFVLADMCRRAGILRQEYLAQQPVVQQPAAPPEQKQADEKNKDFVVFAKPVQVIPTGRQLR